MGREVTITEPELDATGFYPKGPASLCLEAPPQRQCYAAPEDFGRDPEVAVVQVDKDTPALFFSVESGGVSGFRIHFALLQPGDGKDLKELFLSDTEVSDQSQHAFWKEASISDSQIFVTANYVQGPNESHNSDHHRYIISAYVRRPSTLVDGLFYYLEDQYMTAHTYSLDTDILSAEKPEILTRLVRAKTATELQRPPR